MDEVSLNLEPAELAAWLWWAVAALALVEAARYVRNGRRPGSATSRSLLVLGAVVAILALKLSGTLRLDARSHGWACLWLGILVGTWLVRAYRRTTRSTSPRMRVALVSLRLTALLVLLAMVAGPVLEIAREHRERAVIGILVDNSLSMGVRDVTDRAAGGSRAEPVSRIEAVRRLLEANRTAIRRLRDRLDVRWFAFDAATRDTESPSLAATGDLTALADSVQRAQAALMQTGAKVAGVIVLSDGRDTGSVQREPAEVGDALAIAGIPLYSVGIGSDLPAGQTRSLRGRRLDLPDRVSVLNRLAVRAEFLAAGLAGETVEVELQFDGRTVDRTETTPTEVRAPVHVELSHVPEEGGLHKVTVIARARSLASARGEASLSRFVQVTEDKVQVLYIDRGRYERAAIARALELSKELNVTKVDLNQPEAGPGGSPLPSTPAGWGLYHVVLIGDVDRARFPDRVMEAIRDLVAIQGQGAALLGGLRTIGSGQYRGTALDEVFPVDLGAIGEMPPAVEFRRTQAGTVHPVLQLAAETANAEGVWERLPPFAGASPLTGLGAAVEVLLESADGEPLMVVQEAGKGRTAVLAFDSTWQWAFAIDEGQDVQHRFWRQLVLWLANRKPEVWVLTERSQYDLARLQTGAERVVTRAGMVDRTTGGLPARATISGTLIAPDGKTQPVEWTATAEGFEARLPVTAPGEYRLKVEGKVGGIIVGDSQAAFVVESTNQELADPLADLDTLRRMAGRTGHIGGGYVPPEGFGQLLEQIRAAGHETRIARVQRSYLVDEHPWFWLCLFVGLLTIEWVVRRRKGLV